MSNLVPYGFELDLLPQEQVQTQGVASGVWFTFEPDRLDFLLATLDRWFEHRDEVTLVDYGTTDKQGLGCIVMEWDGCSVDQLFLDILRTDDQIIDYTVYEIGDCDE